MKITHLSLTALAMVGVSAFAITAFAAAPAAPGAPAAAAPAPARPPVEDAKVKTFATLPDAEATENICQAADGSVFVTQINVSKLLKISADGKTVTEFASDPKMAHFVGVACGDNEVALITFEKTFRGTPAVAATATAPAVPAGPLHFGDVNSHVYVYDLAGKMTADIKAPATHGLNGFSYSGTPGIYYASNSTAGMIDKIDTKAKTITEWYNDAKFGPTPATAIGINGVKVNAGWVYFAGVNTNGLYKIQIGADGKPSGAAVTIQEGLRPDDFAVTANGDVYFPVGTTMYKSAAAGGAPTKAADPVQGGPSATVTRDGKSILWPTRGGTDKQRILQLPL